MKFLVLALFVCAANGAAFYPGYGPGANKYSAQNRVASRVVTAAPAFPNVYAKAVAVSGPAVTPVVASPVVSSPVVSAPVSVPVVPLAKNVYYETNPEIIENSNEITPNGYSSKVATADGTAIQSTGTLKRVGDADVLVVSGSYRYRNIEGDEVVVNYVADENGYQPQSDSIPVPPAIPEPILRSLAYIASQPKYEETVKKF